MDYKQFETLSDNLIIEETFKRMGIRGKKNTALHILKENVCESNLINDISDVDFTFGNNGATNLKEIEGSGTFIDDIYIYGYLREEDIVFTQRGDVKCTEGVNGSSHIIVNLIRTITRQTIAKNTEIPPHVHTMHTVSLDSKNSNIVKTINTMEKKKNVRENWTYIKGQEPKAIIELKVDLSNVPIEDLEDNFVLFERELFANGFYIYCVDYTKDFSGTLSKTKLIDYLYYNCNFKMEGDKEGIYTNEKFLDEEHYATILNNDNSVGGNVLTYIRSEDNNIFRTKFYNKAVSNFEAGDVRNRFGGHLFDYVFSSNLRLRKIFWEKDVQERGVTRIEISVYGLQNPVSKEIGDSLINKELERTNYLNQKLFYIQPPQKQWTLLAERIDKCFFLVDREETTIYVAWYGNKKTGRVCGVKIDYNRKKDKTNIENLIKWAISDFGFRMVPIFVVEILGYTENTLKLSPLRCFVKEENTTTILTPSKKPGENNKDKLSINIQDFLPETKTIKWEWRNKGLPPFDKRNPTCKIIEMPELTKDKQVSLLSTRERQEREEDLEEAKRNNLWIRRAGSILSPDKEKIQYIFESIRFMEKEEKEKEENLDFVVNMFNKIEPINLSNYTVGRYHILGWKKAKFSSIVLLRNTEKGSYIIIYANTRLEKFLKIFSPYFYSNGDKNNKIYFYRNVTVCEDNYFKIYVAKKTKYFVSGRWLEYFPIFVDENISSKLKTEITEIIKEEEKNIPLGNLLLKKIDPPENNKDCLRCVDIEEGEYKILAYAQYIFRGKTKTVLYMEELENTQKQYLVSGYWIEEEVRKIEENKKLSLLPLPVICRMGMFKTTPIKKRARTCSIQFLKEK